MLQNEALRVLRELEHEIKIRRVKAEAAREDVQERPDYLLEEEAADLRVTVLGGKVEGRGAQCSGVQQALRESYSKQGEDFRFLF